MNMCTYIGRKNASWDVKCQRQNEHTSVYVKEFSAHLLHLLLWLMSCFQTHPEWNFSLLQRENVIQSSLEGWHCTTTWDACLNPDLQTPRLKERPERAKVRLGLFSQNRDSIYVNKNYRFVGYHKVSNHVLFKSCLTQTRKEWKHTHTLTSEPSERLVYHPDDGFTL